MNRTAVAQAPMGPPTAPPETPRASGAPMGPPPNVDWFGAPMGPPPSSPDTASALTRAPMGPPPA
jgi:hypothetical protein